MRAKKTLAFAAALVFAALGLASAPALAGELDEVNPDLAAQLFLKVLSYDRNLRSRSGGKLILAIVYRPDREDSERMRGVMQSAFLDRASKSNVQGMALSVSAVPVDGRTLTKRLQDVGATILYVTPAMEEWAGVVSAAALALKAPTITSRRSLLDAGMAIAVITKDDKPGIVINLPVTKALGMDLDSNLLRLSEVKR